MDQPASFLDVEDASTLCRRCGLSGRHATSAQCIDALRDAIATLENGWHWNTPPSKKTVEKSSANKSGAKSAVLSDF